MELNPDFLKKYQVIISKRTCAEEEKPLKLQSRLLGKNHQKCHFFCYLQPKDLKVKQAGNCGRTEGTEHCCSSCRMRAGGPLSDARCEVGGGGSRSWACRLLQCPWAPALAGTWSTARLLLQLTLGYIMFCAGRLLGWIIKGFEALRTWKKGMSWKPGCALPFCRSF